MKSIKLFAALSVPLLLSIISGYASAFDVVHEFDAQNPPGNIAVTDNGRIFMSNHFFYGAKYNIVEIDSDGKAIPYPSPEFSAQLNPVLGIVADKQGTLWMLETAGEKTDSGRLIAWDTKRNQLKKVIYIAAPHIPSGSFLNDLAIDLSNNAVYITDTASPDTAALLVVDLSTGEVRRVLENTPYTRPENTAMMIDGKELHLGAEGARIGVNPITIDANDRWVYFAPMTGKRLYRVKTADLLNQELSTEKLAERVEDYAAKPFSDGITIDNKGNIYVSDITQASVGVIKRDKSYQTLHHNEETLSWPDGFANGPNGEIYATVNKLHKSPVLNKGNDESGGKYYIIKFDALADLPLGR